MSQSIRIRPFRAETFNVQVRHRRATNVEPENGQPSRQVRRSRAPIKTATVLKVLVCSLGLTVVSGCADLRQHVSGRSWSEIAGQELHEQDVADEAAYAGD